MTQAETQTAHALHVPPCPFPIMLDGDDRADEKPCAKEYSSFSELTRKEQVESTRCYWAICKCSDDQGPSLSFVYVDPRAYQQLGDRINRASILDFVCPDEQVRVRDHLRTIVLSQTLFGSVVQCKFVSLTSMLAYRHGLARPEYVTTDIIVSWVGEQLALCFFHVADDASCACGLKSGSFGPAECQRLWDSLWNSGAKTPRPMTYVFQILSTDHPRAVLMSWPPPHAYNAQDFAKLVKDAKSPDDVTCTNRLRASHALHTNQYTYTVASVLVSCSSILLACFQIVDTELRHTRQQDAKAGETVSFKRPRVDSVVVAAKSCSSCGKTDSPEWRRGPSGQKTLCNACGLRYSRSLVGRQRRNDDETMRMTLPTGNPMSVPPSRGTGGGSRSGAHRRMNHQSLNRLQDDKVSERELSEFDRRLKNVLESLSQPSDIAKGKDGRDQQGRAFSMQMPLSPAALAASRPTMYVPHFQSPRSNRNNASMSSKGRASLSPKPSNIPSSSCMHASTRFAPVIPSSKMSRPMTADHLRSTSTPQVTSQPNLPSHSTLFTTPSPHAPQEAAVLDKMRKRMRTHEPEEDLQHREHEQIFINGAMPILTDLSAATVTTSPHGGSMLQLAPSLSAQSVCEPSFVDTPSVSLNFTNNNGTI